MALRLHTTSLFRRRARPSPVGNCLWVFPPMWARNLVPYRQGIFGFGMIGTAYDDEHHRSLPISGASRIPMVSGGAFGATTRAVCFSPVQMSARQQPSETRNRGSVRKLLQDILEEVRLRYHGCVLSWPGLYFVETQQHARGCINPPNERH